MSKRKTERKWSRRYVIGDNSNETVSSTNKKTVVQPNVKEKFEFITCKQQIGHDLQKRDKYISLRGLKIKNTLHLENGKTKYLNNSSISAIKSVPGIPIWATDWQVKRYMRMLKKQMKEDTS